VQYSPAADNNNVVKKAFEFIKLEWVILLGTKTKKKCQNTRQADRGKHTQKTVKITQ
jgi:hypothetical protein